MLPQRATIQPDPPTREKTIVVNQVFQSKFIMDTTSKLNITPAFIATSFPGGAFWSRMRIDKVSVWGQTLVGNGIPAVSGAIIVDIPSDASWNQPPMRFTDDAVQGQSRPRIAFRLGLLDRARFFTSADETIICTILGTSTEQFTLQFSLQLVSPPVA